MEREFVRNHDHLDFDSMQRCESVRELSRFTPMNEGNFEPLEALLSRVDEVADGMRVVMQRSCQNPQEN